MGDPRKKKEGGDGLTGGIYADQHREPLSLVRDNALHTSGAGLGHDHAATALTCHTIINTGRQCCACRLREGVKFGAPGRLRREYIHAGQAGQSPCMLPRTTSALGAFARWACASTHFLGLRVCSSMLRLLPAGTGLTTQALHLCHDPCMCPMRRPPTPPTVDAAGSHTLRQL